MPPASPPISELILSLPREYSDRGSEAVRLCAPFYFPPPDAAERQRLFFTIESFNRHMTDEGRQLQDGLRGAGYLLCGNMLDEDERNVERVVRRRIPAVAIMQDKREWDPASDCCIDKTNGFINHTILADCQSVFKLTVCKDSHLDPDYHRRAAQEIGCHAWIVYYNPRIVCHLAPYVRPQHVVRTWHSLDPAAVPPYSFDRRRGTLLSGAMNRDLYPFRWRLAHSRHYLPSLAVLPHPGYHARGSHTGAYLSTLSRYRLAFCTASVFGYSLRKLIEATACGCVVFTDLPPDEVLPEIDENLIRVHPNIDMSELRELMRFHHAHYDQERQRHFSERAVAFYDYRRRGVELAAAIERMRQAYAAT